MTELEPDNENNVIENKSKIRFNGTKFKGFIILGALVFMVLFGSKYIFHSNANKSSSVKIAKRPSSLQEISPESIDKIDEVTREALNTDAEVNFDKMKDGKGSAYRPPSTVLIVHDDDNKKQDNTGEQINDDVDAIKIPGKIKRNNKKSALSVNVSYLNRLQKEINSVLSDKYIVDRFVMNENLYAYVEPNQTQDNIQNDNISQIDNVNKLPFNIPFMKVIFGQLILGYNSDGSNEMIAELLTGKYRGARLFGSISATKYIENAYIKFNTMVFKDKLYSINAIAVDAKSNIPSIEGKVKKHWGHNVVYGFGISFLNALSNVYRIDANPLAGVPVVGNVYQNADSLLKSTTVGAVGETLSSMGKYRPPTYTKKAYSSVGIVFLPNSSGIKIPNNNSDTNNGQSDIKESADG